MIQVNQLKSHCIYNRNQFCSDSGLINYWAFSGDFNDYVGGANLYGAVNVVFTQDQTTNQNSSIYVNNGYLIAPKGVYFSGPITYTLWVNVKIATNWARFFDFCFQYYQCSGVYLAIQTNRNLGVHATNGSDFFTSSKSLTLNNWQHIAVTYDGYFARIYLNGTLANQFSLSNLPSNEIRYSNFIGKSNANAGDALLNSEIDELKFFNRALNNTEIYNDMIFIN